MNFKITFYNFSGRYVYGEHQNARLAYAIEAKTNWALLNLRNTFPVFNQENEDYLEFCQLNTLSPIFPSDIQSQVASGMPVFNGNEISYFFYHQDFNEEYKKLFFNLFKGWSFNGNFNKLVLVGTEEELDKFQKTRNQVVMEPRVINAHEVIEHDKQNQEIKELPKELPMHLDFSSKDQINIYEES
jgi:hypothetical protein